MGFHKSWNRNYILNNYILNNDSLKRTYRWVSISLGIGIIYLIILMLGDVIDALGRIQPNLIKIWMLGDAIDALGRIQPNLG